MSRFKPTRNGFVAFALAVVCATICLAAYSDLVCTVQSVSGETVTVSVHNPTGVAATGRVRVTVRLADQSTETLTSGNVEVSGGATTPVALDASQEVSVILEGPEPFPPF